MSLCTKSELEDKLVNLDKLKSFFPDFEMKDFCMFEKIISLKWEPIVDIGDWEEHKNLFLEMASADNYKIPKLAHFPENVKTLHQYIPTRFYIKDMSARGYEKCSKYEVGDYEEECIKFYCSNIVIKDLEKIY